MQTGRILASYSLTYKGNKQPCVLVYYLPCTSTSPIMRKCQVAGGKQRGSEVQGLVRMDGIVDALPVLEEAVELGDGVREACHLVELLGVSRAGSLHTAVKLGGVGRQHEELDIVVVH